MIIAAEPLERAYPDIERLAADHYAETCHTLPGLAAPIPMEMDAAAYRALALAGLLRIFTARDGDALAGYASFIVAGSNLHHRGLKYAANDGLYVVPQYRGSTGAKLIGHAERTLAAEGCRLITLTVPDANDWGALAEWCGYQRTERQYQKWVGGKNS